MQSGFACNERRGKLYRAKQEFSSAGGRVLVARILLEAFETGPEA
jgi:hypothetical protein